ncbi:unnamed protein product [Albugo candida]|uniref:Secreted protein n=1 Tax=Albugo candida TaxID=65357 RepID=A0A024GF55_9STRA|nr:unnamed protein product [Albugo candida]|eukprot:CCI45499.1 unnamed protein product [Albugo candida]
MSLYFFARYDWLILCACDGAVCAKRKKRYCAMTPHNPRRHENGKKRYDSFRSTIFDECTHSGFPKVYYYGFFRRMTKCCFQNHCDFQACRANRRDSRLCVRIYCCSYDTV